MNSSLLQCMNLDTYSVAAQSECFIDHLNVNEPFVLDAVDLTLTTCVGAARRGWTIAMQFREVNPGR